MREVLEVAGRGNGFAGKKRREIVTAAVARYRQAMRDFAGMTNLDVWYARADVDDLQAQFQSQMKARQRKMVDKGMAKARTSDSMQALGKLTRVVDGRPRIIADPPVLVPITDLLPKGTDQAAFAAPIKCGDDPADRPGCSRRCTGPCQQTSWTRAMIPNGVWYTGARQCSGFASVDPAATRIELAPARRAGQPRNLLATPGKPARPVPGGSYGAPLTPEPTQRA